VGKGPGKETPLRGGEEKGRKSFSCQQARVDAGDGEAGNPLGKKMRTNLLVEQVAARFTGLDRSLRRTRKSLDFLAKKGDG